MQSRLATCALFLLVLGVVALIYWPLSKADFVWDDIICLRDPAWLRQGDAWKHYVFRDFCDWTNYFRPLAVGLFVVEVRLFDVAPGPMHLVSLALHVLNTLLVGFLVIAADAPSQIERRTLMLAAVAMTLYGLHPALVEPVAWISSQTELLLTCFILLGLLLNRVIRHHLARAVLVASCFFLGACAKESAVAFPLVLFLFDWIDPRYTLGRHTVLREILGKQLAVYAAVFVAGVAYLGLRWGALGHLVDPHIDAEALPPLLARLQEACFAYLTYWRILLWPAFDLGPMHVVNMDQFVTVDAFAIAIDALSMLVCATGIWFLRKRHPIGSIVLCVTVVLLPALHILPVAFDASLYHARYAMTAVALVCILATKMAIDSPLSLRPWRAALATVFLAWLGMAIVNIRVTLPLWADETHLWQWELRTNPKSVPAKASLLAIYMKQGNRPGAHAMLTALTPDIASCPSCLLDAAYLALAEGDLQQAGAMLDTLRNDSRLTQSPRLLHTFIEVNALLLEAQNDLPRAEEAYRDAINVDPLEPVAQMRLAILLWHEGKREEAQRTAELAVLLFPPDVRDVRRHELRQVFGGVAGDRQAPTQ